MRKLKLFLTLLMLMCVGVTQMWGEKITDYTKIVSGKTYYIGATTSSTDYYLSVDGSSTSTSIAGTAVTSSEDATAFVFSGSGTSWTIQFDGGTYYLGLKNSKDNGKVQVVASAATFTASNQSSKIRLTIGSYSIQKNNQTAAFGSYGNTQTDVWLEEVPSTPSYAITAESNNTDYGTVSLSGSVITGAPAEGYRYANPAYTVTVGTAEVSQNGNAFTVTPSEDCTVRINFEEIPSHNINFNINGGSVDPTSVSVKEGVTYTELPTVTGLTANCEFGDFEGWTAATSISNGAKPEMVTSVTMSTTDVTLNAVYSKTEGGSASVEKSITFSDNYSADTEVDGVEIALDNCTLTFAKSTGSNAPKYYATGTAVRLYAKGTLTVSSSNNITNIVLTFGSGDGSNAITANVGTYENGTWAGEATSVVLTEGGTSGNRRIAGVAVTTSGGGTTTYSLNAGCCEQYEAPALSYTTPLQKNGEAVSPTWASALGVTGVTYASSNTDAVTVNETTGVISPVGAGAAVITASWDAQDGKCAGSKESNTITVNGTVDITFNGNGAEGSMEAQSVNVGEATKLNANAFEAPACKAFGGWATEAEGEKVYDDEGNITASAAMTLYAVWNTIQYTVAQADAHVGAASVELSASTVDCDGEITITATADATHKGDPTITFEGTATLVDNKLTNIRSNITNVKVTYTEKDQFAITWNVNGAALEGAASAGVTTSVYEGNTIENLPSVADDVLACTNKFMGWSRKNYNTVPKTAAAYDDLFTTGAGAGAINQAETFYAVFAKQTSSDPVEHNNVISWERSSTTDTYTEGYTFNGTASAKTGYYQDASSGTGALKLYHTSTALFTSTPSSVTLTANIGGGTADKTLTNAVYAQLLDKDGNGIGTPIVITSTITTAGGDTYTPSFDLTGITSAYGVQVYHEKESGYNVRYYSFSLSYVSGGSTSSNYVTQCAAVAAPTFSVAAGTYDEVQSVELECETEGVAIYYTTDDTEPTSASTLYENAIAVNQSMTIKAVAILNSVASEVNTAAYELKVKTPTISGDANFMEKTTVTLACEDENATIYYTVGEAEEVAYTAPFEVNATATVTAVAKRTGWTNSESASQNFTKIEVMTVAEAIQAIDAAAGETINDQYVKGIIAEVTEYSSQYHSLTYWISDNGTDKTLKVYSGKSFDGANFSSKDDLLVGDEVVVKGNLLYYNNSEYEVNYNNILIVRKQRVLSIALSGEYMTECNEGAEFSHEGMVVTATYNYGDAADVTAEASWTTPDLSVEGEKTVTVSYTFDGKTVTKDYTITVNHVCAASVTITKGEEANGTFTLSATEVCGDGDGATVEVTDIEPAEGYRFKEITTSASGDVDNDLKKVTGITAATTITVVFEEIPSYEVTWNVNGDETTKTSVQEGSKPAFPATPTSCDESSTTFYGWATAAWTGKAENLNEKTFYTSAADMPEVNAAVTYYAVFAKATAGDPVPTTLWSEDFSSYENGDVPEGGSPISYSVTDGGGTTKIYTSQLGAGGESPELLVAKSNGTFTASGIATNGVSTATLTYHTNQTSNLTVATSAEHITIGDVSVDGTDTKLCTRTITFAEGAPEAFDLTFTMTAGSNSRLDDIVLSAEIPSVSYVDYLTTCCQKYTITIDSEIENGSVEADLAQACENDEVTLTPTAVGPYHFDAWNVSYNDGENDQTVTVTNNKFNMPAFNVTVSATFVHDDCKALAAPTLDGEVVVDYQSALFAWNAVVKTTEDEDVAANGVVGYVINVSEHEGDPVVEDANITDLTDLSYLVENLDPETQYDFTIMAVGDGTDYCAVNTAYTGNFTTEALPTATLTLSENGTTHDYEGEYILGQTIQLPDAADCSKVFVGWSANAECAIAPEYEAGDDYTLAATTQTLYAVYATEGAGASSTLFSETFDGCTNTGGNDGSWSGSIANGTLSLTGWTCVKGSAADACAKFGTTSALGSAQTPAIEVTGAATLTFRAGAWNGNSENTNLKLSATGATLDKSSVTLVKGAFTEYTVAITEANGSVTIMFEGNSASNSRFFLDDVVLSQSAITYSEYSTTCEALLAAPTFSLAEQEEPFTTAQTVELAATEGTIYYTLDGTTPTNESTEYTAAIELNQCGEFTIKAIAISATSHSAVVSASYTINIPLLDNSELIPYTPAQAIEVFDGGCYTNEKVYVKGVVKTSSGLNTTYGNYDNIVVVAEETTAPEFTFFHMYKGASKTQFDANDPAIVAGDTIVAYGELTKYGQIYEFKDGCYLIDRKAYAESKQSIANDIEHPYTLAEAIEFLDNPTTYDLSEEVYVKGVATTAPNVNNTFTAHDPEVENVFQFYTTNLNDLTVGVNDTIIVKGLIKKVNANYRMESGVVQEVKAYVAHTISVNPSAVAFDEVEQNASVDAIEFDVYLTNVASATVTLGGTNASAFSIGEVATLTENGKITVSVVSTDLEIGDYAATITISDDADVAEDVVVNVTMTIIATDSRHKAFSPTAGFTATSGDLNPADITYASAKGDGTADPNVTDGKILYYQPGSGKAAGGYMTLTAVKGCTIDQVKVVTAENNATSIKYSKDGGNLSEATGVEAGANYLTPASLNAQTVNIYCAGADKNHRLYVEQVVVYYTGEAMPVLSYSVDASGVVTTEFPMNGEFSSEGLKVYACYDATCDDKVDITNQCNVVADLSSIGAKKAEVYLGEEKLGEYDINVVEGRENPALAYTPASATIGAAEVGGWTAPVLSNPFQVTPIYSSNNEAVATVTTEGVITLAGGYGTVVIKATFAETEEYIASEATYTLTISEPINKIEGEWHKATSITDLAIGAKIIFVGAKNNTKYAMGAQNNNNRAAVAVLSETEGVITAAEGTKTFTLVDAGDGKFAFRANNGKYLYAAGSGSGSNYLREQTTLNGDAMWTITYDANGAATIQANGSHTNNMLRFNTSLLFSCYASGQSEAAIYVNSKEYAGSNDPENPANVEVTTDVVEEEIVANGNIVLTVNANTFQEPKTYVAQNGATIIINNSGTETEAKSVIVDENSTIEIQKPTTVNEYFYVAAKKGQGTTTSSTTASQINNADMVHVASPGHFDFTLAVPGNIAKDQWHDFSVPFPVNATTGVMGKKNGEWQALEYNVDYAIMYHRGDKRANKEKEWYWCTGVMQPGKLYSLTVEGSVVEFRFVKTNDAYDLESQDVTYDANAEGAGNADDDYGWNALGTTKLNGAIIAPNGGSFAGVYVLLNTNEGYGQVNTDGGAYKLFANLNDINLMLGSAFFIQVSAAGSLDFQAPGAGVNYAPARMESESNGFEKIKVTLSDGNYTDNLYLSASEDAENRYERGKDLVKKFATATPIVPTLYTTNYGGKKLGVEYAPLTGNTVNYALTLFAPKAGEYTIAASQVEGEIVYLTYNGSIIWNLSMNEYTVDLNQGTDELYGIRVVKAPQVITGIENGESAEAGVQKVVIDQNVYILRNKQMYDVTGKAVK